MWVSGRAGDNEKRAVGCMSSVSVSSFSVKLRGLSPSLAAPLLEK
ncbi:hypothetical protein HPTD01_3820 [Halomonas sp. TD01]|nr:hypothetical protein HPTD01_3820 [Halomonas sp. TD01]